MKKLAFATVFVLFAAGAAVITVVRRNGG